MKEKRNKIYYRRNLPHYQPEGCTFFVTFRLNNSLPINVIKNLIKERIKELRLIANIESKSLKKLKYYEYQQRYFEIFDNHLDNNKGTMWLMQEEIASVVKEAIHYRDGREYELVAYTIMPNHVHMVFTPIENSPNNDIKRFKELHNDREKDTQIRKSTYRVTEILQGLKRYTALKCNKILKRHGAFWHHESYDHVVRNQDELKRIVKYILENPVKANLVEDIKKWKWSYYNPKYLL